MRTIDCEVNGTVWRMPVNFAAVADIDEKVGDPFKLVLRLGDRDNPIGVRECIRIVHLGCMHAGCKLGEKIVGQWVIEEGFTKVLNTVVAPYLNSLVMGPPKGSAEESSEHEKKQQENPSPGDI